MTLNSQNYFYALFQSLQSSKMNCFLHRADFLVRNIVLSVRVHHFFLLQKHMIVKIKEYLNSVITIDPIIIYHVFFVMNQLLS